MSYFAATSRSPPPSASRRNLPSALLTAAGVTPSARASSLMFG